MSVVVSYPVVRGSLTACILHCIVFILSAELHPADCMESKLVILTFLSVQNSGQWNFYRTILLFHRGEFVSAPSFRMSQLPFQGMFRDASLKAAVISTFVSLPILRDSTREIAGCLESASIKATHHLSFLSVHLSSHITECIFGVRRFLASDSQIWDK